MLKIKKKIKLHPAQKGSENETVEIQFPPPTLFDVSKKRAWEGEQTVHAISGEGEGHEMRLLSNFKGYLSPLNLPVVFFISVQICDKVLEENNKYEALGILSVLQTTKCNKPLNNNNN